MTTFRFIIFRQKSRLRKLPIWKYAPPTIHPPQNKWHQKRVHIFQRKTSYFLTAFKKVGILAYSKKQNQNFMVPFVS